MADVSMITTASGGGRLNLMAVLESIGVSTRCVPVGSNIFWKVSERA